MPRLIWVFAGRTVTLLVLTCRGSCFVSKDYDLSFYRSGSLWNDRVGLRQKWFTRNNRLFILTPILIVKRSTSFRMVLYLRNWNQTFAMYFCIVQRFCVLSEWKATYGHRVLTLTNLSFHRLVGLWKDRFLTGYLSFDRCLGPIILAVQFYWQHLQQVEKICKRILKEL